MLQVDSLCKENNYKRLSDMTEKEKMMRGMIYDANNDPQLIAERTDCKELCHDYNPLRPKDAEGRRKIITELLGSVKKNFLIEQPFLCDYGYNIHIGDNFYANHNLVILDEATLPGVTIGDDCVIGAGSVVVKDIPAHSVAVGNPCEVIKTTK